MDSPQEATQLPQPIVLSEGSVAQNPPVVKGQSGFFATFGLLLSGWLLGNLILLALLSTLAVFTVGYTGLVKIPVLTEYFFGKYQVQGEILNPDVLKKVEEKLSLINNLSKGQRLESISFNEEEINSLVARRFQQTTDFPLVNPRIDLFKGGFNFTAILKETKAPVLIRGEVFVVNTIGKIEITAAKFGKAEIPTFIASYLIDSLLSQVGLSLSGSQIPSREVVISESEVLLKEIVSQQD